MPSRAPENHNSSESEDKGSQSLSAWKSDQEIGRIARWLLGATRMPPEVPVRDLLVKTTGDAKDRRWTRASGLENPFKFFSQLMVFGKAYDIICTRLG